MYPLLFLVFINVMTSVVDCHTILFTDATKFIIVDSTEIVAGSLSSNLNAFCNGQ